LLLLVACRLSLIAACCNLGTPLQTTSQTCNAGWGLDLLVAGCWLLVLLDLMAVLVTGNWQGQVGQEADCALPFYISLVRRASIEHCALPFCISPDLPFCVFFVFCLCLCL
jgi:hypothetical protein